ncbi:MAG TPA: glycosyltransferase family 87 protein [Chitinophagaceae bacterium]
MAGKKQVGRGSGNTPLNTFLSLIPLSALLAWLVFTASGAPLSDFAGYFFGSKLILAGDYASAYDTYSLNLMISGEGFKNVFVSYTPFTPFTSVVFSPFLVFENPFFSKTIFNLTGALLFIISVYRLSRYTGSRAWISLLLPVIFFTPLKNNIAFGQAYLLLFFLLAEGFLAFEKKNNLAGGLYWGAAILFKVFPALLVFHLLLKKQYRSALWLGCATTALWIATIPFTGWEPWRHYLGLLPRLNAGELNDSFTYMFQSFYMLVKNLFVYDRLLNPAPLATMDLMFIFLVIAFKGIIFGVATGFSLGKNTTAVAAIAGWIMAAMLLSPNGSNYSLVLLVFAFLSIPQIKPRKTWLTASLLLLLAICNLPVQSFAALPHLLRYPRLYLFLLLFAVFAIALRTRFNRYAAFAVIFLLALQAWLTNRKDKDRSGYLLLKEKHILITDLFASGNRLAYSWWSGSGAGTETTDFPAPVKPLEIQDNQVMLNGKKITSGGDLKKSAFLLDEQTVIYLSDKNRGIGFYTIRMMQVPD